MTTENVFVTIALINQLKDVMTFNFPYGILYGAETLISIKRIQVSIKIALISCAYIFCFKLFQEFLLLDEIQKIDVRLICHTF